MAALISALLATWFTPSSLFIVVNLVIGTIAVTSRFTSPKKQTHHESQLGPQLVRPPSLLERVRSFRPSHYAYNTYEPTVPLSVSEPAESTHPQLVRTPSLLERVRSFNFGLHKYETEEHVQAQAQAQQHEPEGPKEPKLARAPSLLQRLQSTNLSRMIYRSDTVHADEEPEPEPEGPDSEGGRGSGAKVSEMMRKSASERARAEKCEWEEGEDEATAEKRRPETARCETTSLLRDDEEVDAKADDFINRFKKQLRLQRVNSILRRREMQRGS